MSVDAHTRVRVPESTEHADAKRRGSTTSVTPVTPVTHGSPKAGTVQLRTGLVHTPAKSGPREARVPDVEGDRMPHREYGHDMQGAA